jgi:hypothetical protein
MKVLPVIRSFGGCGGTLLARMFGALPGCVVLSETNPRSANLFGGHLNPLSQLRQWRPELTEHFSDWDESEIGYPPRFGEMLDILTETATKKELRLLVRDYTYVDFIGVPYVWPVPCDCSLDMALNGRFAMIELFLVRRPPDQLASLRIHPPFAHVITAERLLDGYRAFLAAKPDVPIYHYEDLMAAPQVTFRRMCETLQVPFDVRGLTDFQSVKHVTGHIGRLSELQIKARQRSDEARAADRDFAALSGYGDLLAALRY